VLLPQRPDLCGSVDQVDELCHLTILTQAAQQGVSQAIDLIQGGVGGPRALAQDLGVLGGEHCQLVTGGGAFEAAVQVPGVQVAVDLVHFVGLWVFPAQLHGGDAPLGVGLEHHGVHGSGAVTSTQLAGIHTVVPEILVGDGAVLVADQAVVGDHVGVEVDLHAGVAGDGLQGGGQVVDEQLAGLIQIVHIGVAAVAVVGQLLHKHIVQVAYTTD